AAPAAAPVSENELYQRAKSAFDQGQHEGALRDFKAFIQSYPKSGNADNAQFWIGEIYYRDQMFEQAILEYQKVIEQYPKGNKAQASMLKQGLAFYRLGDKANARLFLNELIDKYPQSPEASIARQKLNNF
ncbi:MAG: tol-pal system protein YbgF, partial [Desulfobacterales bacterium]